MTDKCQWCGMEPRGFKANRIFFWKCETKQKPNGSRIQSDACVEIARLKARAVLLEKVAEAAKVLSEDKRILDAICFPHALFQKWQAVQDALAVLEAP